MEDRQLLELVVGRLTDLPSAVRQTLTDHQWASIALTVNEYGFSASLTAGTPLQVPRRTAILFRVNLIVASVPPGATGTIALSDLTIPVPAGVTVIPCPEAAGMILQTSDTVTLTTASANGPAALWLSGVQLPTYGQMT